MIKAGDIVKCIDDKVWQKDTKLVHLVKDRCYQIHSIVTFQGTYAPKPYGPGIHYGIKDPYGLVRYYYHKRFIYPYKETNLKIL